MSVLDDPEVEHRVSIHQENMFGESPAFRKRCLEHEEVKAGYPHLTSSLNDDRFALENLIEAILEDS